MLSGLKGLFHNIEESIHPEEIKILNMHAHNKRALKYMNQRLLELQGETGKSTMIEISTSHS